MFFIYFITLYIFQYVYWGGGVGKFTPGIAQVLPGIEPGQDACKARAFILLGLER